MLFSSHSHLPTNTNPNIIYSKTSVGKLPHWESSWWSLNFRIKYWFPSSCMDGLSIPLGTASTPKPHRRVHIKLASTSISPLNNKKNAHDTSFYHIIPPWYFQFWISPWKRRWYFQFSNCATWTYFRENYMIFPIIFQCSNFPMIVITYYWKL